MKEVDDEWRRWIGESLSLESRPANIIQAMVANGFTEQVAAAEVDLALKSPYLRGALQLQSRLKKRDWLLAVYRKSHRLYPKSKEIERRHKLPREEFLTHYYSAGRPVLITGMMDDWPAMQKWSSPFFLREHGDAEVQVQMGRSQGDKGAQFEIEKDKYVSRMRFSDYIQKVEASGATNEVSCAGGVLF